MLEKIWKKILEYDVIVISRHIKPDGDASGSQLGLKYLIQENTKNKKVPAKINITRTLIKLIAFFIVKTH